MGLLKESAAGLDLPASDLLERIQTTDYSTPVPPAIPAPPYTVQEHQGAIIRVLNGIPGLERHNVDTVLYHFNRAVAKSHQRGQTELGGLIIAFCEQKLQRDG